MFYDDSMMMIIIMASAEMYKYNVNAAVITAYKTEFWKKIKRYSHNGIVVM